MDSWYYREMGSRNKKTQKLSYYNVRVTDYVIDDVASNAADGVYICLL